MQLPFAPFTIMVAPMTGCPCSSTIVPVMACCCILAADRNVPVVPVLAAAFAADGIKLMQTAIKKVDK